MSSCTHLYFDHGHEYDPNEIGTRWATPFISTEKVFNYYPMDIFKNADTLLTGVKIDKDEYIKEVCSTETDCHLKYPENIAGMCHS